ncbi:MAG TPA: XRE family transcriptional regulator [Morganella sp. (in: Bacteria)]|nr:XRE family transcriptional regulator [Morganella sp. (in: enterobacteria)]
MENINFIVGQNIRDLRHGNGMSTQTLAKMLGVSQQQLSRYERGINKIDVCIVFKVISIFHISYDCLFPENESDNSDPVMNDSSVYLDPVVFQ